MYEKQTSENYMNATYSWKYQGLTYW